MKLKFIGIYLLLLTSILFASDLTWCEKALENKKVHKYNSAIENFNRCIKEGNLSKSLLARTYRNMGITFNQDEQYKKAIEYYNIGLKYKPQDPEYDYVNLGNAYSNSGEYKKALDYYDKALKIHPNFKHVYYNRGIVYRRIGNIGRAINNFVNAHKYGLNTQKLLSELQDMKEIETRNAAVGYVSSLRMFIEVAAQHCQTKLGKDEQWVKKQISIWEKNNSQYLNAAKKWIRYYYRSIQNYNKEAGEKLMKKNYLTTVKSAEYSASTALYNSSKKTLVENCKIYIEHLHKGAYDITKKNKMYDELENLVHSKKQPLGRL